MSEKSLGVADNVRVNNETREIVVNKAFLKRASIPNTSEYKDLREIKLENPSYKVVPSKRSGRANGNKGLTFQYMKNYISTHDDENKTISKEFKVQMAKRADTTDNKGRKQHYDETVEWFFEKFPSVKTYHQAEKQSNGAEKEKCLDETTDHQAEKTA